MKNTKRKMSKKRKEEIEKKKDDLLFAFAIFMTIISVAILFYKIGHDGIGWISTIRYFD